MSSTEYWECTTSSGNALFSYQLLDDGSGIETDLMNQSAQSGFTWQAISANSMTTTVNASGMQNTFTDISFADRDNMTLEAVQNLTLTCQRKNSQPTTPDVATGDNALSYGGVSYALTHGFEETFWFRATQQGDSHSTSQFSVANAEFKLTTIISSSTNIWRPNDATVWLRAKLHSPGGERFESATFNYEPDTTEDNDPSLANSSFFNDGRFGVDINEDGDIESDDGEFIDVTGGTITVQRLSGNNARMEIHLTLANGVTLGGTFEGLFVLYENN